LPPRSAKVLGHANEHGISANTRFEVCIAKDYPETGFDLAAFFDSLFTTWATWATRPARRRMGQSLKPDGAWMVIEPMAGDRLEDNLNPGGRL
jgi:hypothetical protein